MADRGLRILILEDAPADAELSQRELRRAGLRFEALRVDTRAAFERALQDFEPDLVLSDFSMPAAFDGLSALGLTRERSPDLPFIFVSGTIGEDRAVEAMKRGATDYVLKDRPQRLPFAVASALTVCALPVRTPLRRLLLCNEQVAPGLGCEGELLAASAAAFCVSRTERSRDWMRRRLWTKVEI